jgi:enoyl-CoA hydratase/carnithine racemase
MSLVSSEDRGSVRVIIYANAPFGTMTGIGSAELFSAVVAAGEEPSVRVIVITGGVPRHFHSSVTTTLVSFLMPQKQYIAPRRTRQLRLALDHQASVPSRT